MQLSDFAKILNSTLEGEDAAVSKININTRELVTGELFVALKGDQFDGHDFLQSAIEKNAAGAIISNDHPLPIPTIKVADTRIALGKIAAHHRAKFNLPIIAVTGSCGKTTTKTLIASILSQMGTTLAPIKSFNNDVGVPVTLLQLTDDHQYAVIEMGANHPHEIAYLSSIAKQQVAIITNVAPAHLAGFGSIEGVAQAKSEIYEALGTDGIAIINADDQFASRWLHNLPQKKITFGITNKADVMASNIKLDAEGRALFDVVYPAGKLSIHLPLLGKHNVMNALAAIAATYAVGATSDAIEKGLRQASPVNKRLIKYTGLQGSTILDDSYNANPLSVSAALEILQHIAGEKFFVFGDMGELGDDSEKFHTQIGDKAKQLGINKIFACGKLSRLTAAAFGENGFHFEDQASLIGALKNELHEGAVVLIKGSRFMEMENVVEALIQEN